MATGPEDVYCTLLMSDSYLPGALVLAHSLRDTGTSKKLAALVTLDTLSSDTITKLKEVYDYLIPVERIRNGNPRNLYLMGRPDLVYAFTKIALWRQLQFRKIVYFDADVVALRAPDELFDIDADFAAAPDIGWPDAFNSGVMVIKPNMGDFWALKRMAESGDSFDGADQGLLNQYYEHRAWHRLSFTYNCTPNAQYQWEPAYKYYKSKINAVHFIGKDKPWSKLAQGGGRGGDAGVYNELLNRWWAVFDKHLRVESPAPEPPSSAPPERQPSPEPAATEEPKFSAPSMEWDATRYAPPQDARPEAANFPTQVYQFSGSRDLFKAPPHYPEPPKDMWYEVPKTKPEVTEAPKPIFPWEQGPSRPRATRTFADDHTSPPTETTRHDSNTSDYAEQQLAFTQTSNVWDNVPGIEHYVRAIIGNQQGHKRGKSQDHVGGSPPGVTSAIEAPTPERRTSILLTDFPSPVERPSLPVTPAPIRRPTFWGVDEKGESEQLPPAEGVPDQTEWDPQEKLDELRRNSLIDMDSLKLPPKKQVPKRHMVDSAAPLPGVEEEHNQDQELTKPQNDSQQTPPDLGLGISSQSATASTEVVDFAGVTPAAKELFKNPMFAFDENEAPSPGSFDGTKLDENGLFSPVER